jgi:hypothetical protein
MKGVTVWMEYPSISGFQVEIAFVGKQEMLRIYDESTIRKWNAETRKQEQEVDRRRVAKVWAESVVKGWKGLTVAKFKRLWPVKLDSGVSDDMEIESNLENRISLLWNSSDFENWVLSIATTPEQFEEDKKKAEKEMTNLEK